MLSLIFFSFSALLPKLTSALHTDLQQHVVARTLDLLPAALSHPDELFNVLLVSVYVMMNNSSVTYSFFAFAHRLTRALVC